VQRDIKKLLPGKENILLFKCIKNKLAQDLYYFTVENYPKKIDHPAIIDIFFQNKIT
jgi:hypothetical protein